MTTTVPWQHLLAAVVVMAVWGTNFTIAKLTMEDFPPFLFAALRFICVFFPAVLLIKRPAVSWTNLAAYGLLIGTCQFGLILFAMDGYISVGMASLVIQTQVIFTILLSLILTGEHIRTFQIVAVLMSMTGLGVILVHHDGFTTPLGVALAIGGALCWAGGNTVSRAAGKVDVLAYVVWASLFSFPPLCLLSLMVDGWPVIVQSISHASWGSWLALAWQSVGNTMFGYGVWAWLLARHPAASIAPLSLMVPIFGMATSALVLGEPIQGWKMAAAALVLGGLLLGLIWPRLAGDRT